MDWAHTGTLWGKTINSESLLLGSVEMFFGTKRKLLTACAVWRLKGLLAFALIERGSGSQHTFTTPTSAFSTIFGT